MPRFRPPKAIGALLIVAAVLAIPSADPPLPPAPASARPFTWNRDSVWRGLESRFAAVRTTACADSLSGRAAVAAIDARTEALGSVARAPGDVAFDSLEQAFFSAAPIVAACGALVPQYVAAHARMREAVKAQSRAWDVSSGASRDRLYRALYGGRAAVEEVMLQQPRAVEPLILGPSTATVGRSVTPSAVSNGVTLHSGDMLVSRGGAPTSALIARGNDYPGNFSHVALVHVDAMTHAISVIEAHIEAGVSISTADKYLADRKLRVMVVRPRADLPALQRNPMLPHLAASAMLARVKAGHIPYDFAMDYTDPAKLFCSEVASAAYRAQGLTLWMGISTISREGLRRWLSAFGVRHFATQEPADLEYDPQVHVVAEWHDAAALFDDHVDNAVTDVMLEEADRGAPLAYPWYMLPVSRVLKVYSWMKVQGGGSGPVPEGMSATAALRNRSYSASHAARAAAVRTAAARWQSERGYPPAYWTLVDLAEAGAPAAR